MWWQVYRCVDVGVFEDLAYECVLVSAQVLRMTNEPLPHAACVAEGVRKLSDANLGRNLAHKGAIAI